MMRYIDLRKKVQMPGGVAASSLGAAEDVSSKSFLSWHFCGLCFCQVFSSL